MMLIASQRVLVMFAQTADVLAPQIRAIMIMTVLEMFAGMASVSRAAVQIVSVSLEKAVLNISVSLDVPMIQIV